MAANSDLSVFESLAETFSLIRLRGKIPVEKEWQRFCREKRAFHAIGFRPGDNAGIACGEGSGVLVLDVDDPDIFERTCKERRWLVPETRAHETGSGKPHFLFQHPSDGRQYGNLSKKQYGFDVRGHGGQVVAPGSIHPDTGRSYSIAYEAPIAPPPDWLLGLYAQESSNGTKSQEESTDGFHGFSEGERDEKLFKYACKLRGNLSMEEAKILVLEAARRCTPPFPEDEAIKKLEQAWKYEPWKSSEKEDANEHCLLHISIDECRADRFLRSNPPPVEWLIENSLPKGKFGGLIADGGTGKGFFSLQLALSVATGIPFLDGWRNVSRGKALCLYGEDDEHALHGRVHAIAKALALKKKRSMTFPLDLSTSFQSDFLDAVHENLIIKSVVGEDVRLIGEVNENPGPSRAYHNLLESCTRINDLILVVIDPLSRFYSGEEKDNPLATYFCSLVERISKETGAAVILAHHVNREHGKLRGIAAMTQHALRGATGFANAFRWQLNMAYLAPGDFKRLGIKDDDTNQYVIARVVKKNFGPPEAHFYLERWEGGVWKLADLGEDRDERDSITLAEIIKRIQSEEAKGTRYTVDSFARCFAKEWAGYGRRKISILIDGAINEGVLATEKGTNYHNKKVDWLVVVNFTE